MQVQVLKAELKLEEHERERVLGGAGEKQRLLAHYQDLVMLKTKKSCFVIFRKNKTYSEEVRHSGRSRS